ncbi:Os1348 family NHLP clan protein [Chloroflexota bacterium]
MKETAVQGKQIKRPNEISEVVEELEKDLLTKPTLVPERKAPSGKEAILEVLARAADDHKFLARLAEDPAKVLQEYDLTSEERAALASGDLRRIESWVGKLDKRLSTWIWCRLQQEKW